MTKHLLLATLFLSGVVRLSAQPQEPPAARPAGEVSATDQGANQESRFAYLHVYRQRRYVGSGLSPTITVDSMKVARVGNGRRFTAKVAPGTHTINSDDKSSIITIEAAAGQHYFIRVDEEAGAWKGHGRLTLLMPEQGKPEYQLQKPVEPDRRLAKEMLVEEADIAADALKK
ncbi:MAG: DUF2846 domain-containing protein [Terriglobales bacterium]